MVIEIIIILAVAAGVMSGYRKGLIVSICGVLVLVLCALGGSVAQDLFAEPAMEAIEPKVQEMVAQRLQEQLEEGTRDAVEQAGESGFIIGGQEFTLGGVMELLEQFGLDVEESITEGTSEALTPAVNAAAAAATRAIMEPLVDVLIYMAAFIILYLLLHTVLLGVNLVDRLPVIHTMNRVGGALFGGGGSVLILTVIYVVLRQTGFMPDAEGFRPCTMLLEKLAELLT